MSTPAPTPAEDLANQAIEGATSSVLGRLVLAGVPIGPEQADLVSDVVRGAFAWLADRATLGDADDELTHALIAAVAADTSVGRYEATG